MYAFVCYDSKCSGGERCKDEAVENGWNMHGRIDELIQQSRICVIDGRHWVTGIWQSAVNPRRRIFSVVPCLLTKRMPARHIWVFLTMYAGTWLPRGRHVIYASETITASNIQSPDQSEAVPRFRVLASGTGSSGTLTWDDQTKQVKTFQYSPYY